ncbi:MAG: U32 family peptidase [Ruminococcaceae bacterium]|nr:U32 family peptidase [Oscillospiraceae bacterium]
MNKPELLAPAGSLNKLKCALIYGADAVYAGGEAFSLRAAAKNFTPDELNEGIDFAHARGKKVYIAANIIPHNADLDAFPDYIRSVADMGADGVIISDPGLFALAREYAPDLPIHISTQANNVNWRSVEFWKSQGASRVVLARELSLSEIADIRQKTDMELEAFVHGAMCISYSGRCLLSNYMTGRDANQGACTHPCRWKYALVEEQRPGQYYPVEETERGTFIFNSKDLCMIDHIPELVNAGINSFKIEGRIKNELYLATVVKAYRTAIDAYVANPDGYTFDPALLTELTKASYRGYTTGFFFGKPGPDEQVYGTSSYIQNYEIVGVVVEYDPQTKTALIEQRNRFVEGDILETLNPTLDGATFTASGMKDAEGVPITAAPHPQTRLTMPVPTAVEPYTLLRRKKEN